MSGDDVLPQSGVGRPPGGGSAPGGPIPGIGLALRDIPDHARPSPGSHRLLQVLANLVIFHGAVASPHLRQTGTYEMS